MKKKFYLLGLFVAIILLVAIFLFINQIKDSNEEVPKENKWGVYSLDLDSEEVNLIYSSNKEISGISLDNSGRNLAFSMKEGREMLDTSSDIYTINTDGTNFRRITNNDYFNAYPSFSPDDSRIIFISMRESMSIYTIEINGGGEQQLYDSEEHDSDVHWGIANVILFTKNHQIWSLNSDGTDPKQITNPADAGEWGIANLPVGDYDPRLSPDGSKIVFERLEDPNIKHGGYNLFLINTDGKEEKRLTNNFYTQGLASWSNSGNNLVYIVAVINDQGVFDIYMIDTDGLNNKKITPKYFPDTFLIRQAIFSRDDSKLFFIGEWWI